MATTKGDSGGDPSKFQVSDTAGEGGEIVQGGVELWEERGGEHWEELIDPFT